MKIVLKYTFNEDSSFVFFLNWRENLFTLLFTLNKKKQQKWNGAFFFQDFETLLLNSHESLSIFLQMSNCNCFDGFRCDVLVDPSRSWQFIWDFAHFYSDFHQFLPSFTRSLWTFPLFLHYIFILTIFFYSLSLWESFWTRLWCSSLSECLQVKYQISRYILRSRFLTKKSTSFWISQSTLFFPALSEVIVW